MFARTFYCSWASFALKRPLWQVGIYFEMETNWLTKDALLQSIQLTVFKNVISDMNYLNHLVDLFIVWLWPKEAVHKPDFFVVGFLSSAK